MNNLAVRQTIRFFWFEYKPELWTIHLATKRESQDSSLSSAIPPDIPFWRSGNELWLDFSCFHYIPEHGRLQYK